MNRKEICISDPLCDRVEREGDCLIRCLFGIVWNGVVWYEMVVAVAQKNISRETNKELRNFLTTEFSVRYI